MLRWLFFVCILALVAACQNDSQVFETVSASHTNINFQNNLQKQDLFGILYYLYYYNGGGVAVGDINNDGLPDIYFTANSNGNNKLYLNKGNLEFEDITLAAGVQGSADWCTGVTMADVNGDGLLDIYVCAVSQTHDLQGHNQLYINNGVSSLPEGGTTVTFTEHAASYGLDFSGFSTQSAFFDYDHDGDLDCYLVNQSHHPHQNIVDTSNRRKFDQFAGDRLYRNDQVNGSMKFTDVSATAGIYQSSLGYGLGLAVADINNDGWDDIYVGNDFHENDYYYVNNGNGTFTESGARVFGHYSRFSMGNDVADFNNDGQLDVFTADMLPGDEKVLKTYGSDENADIYKFKVIKNGFQYQYSKNCLQVNNGNGSSFSEVSLAANVSATDWSWSPLFADFDNDGNKDLLVTSGIIKRPVDLDYIKFVSDLYVKKSFNKTDQYDDEALDKMPDGASHPFLFRNNGHISFTDVSEDWGVAGLKGYSNGAAYADLDNDGDLDLAINNLNAKAHILKNVAPKRNYLQVAFKGLSFNTKGIGAKAYVFSGGKMQYQQLMLTRGFESSGDARLHFGLANNAKVDSLLIVWPSQSYQLVKGVGLNKLIVADERQSASYFSYTSFFPPPPLLLSPDSTIQVNWQHQENDFTDFNVQYLIPHGQSTRGPRVAVSDVNEDGLEDYYVCGAKGQPGTLMLQRPGGAFIPGDSNVFEADALCEDVDALFLDANGDSKPDLYVVSGGNEAYGNDSALLDRLYLNDGTGHFKRSAGSLPYIFQNKSSVSAADFDKDGDLDLVVTTLANAKAYGLPQTSYLLINDGKAHYSIAGEQVISLAHIGLVTSSSFADLNGDGWPDLVLAGEWMPVTVFINHQGRFTKTALPNTTGLWQSLFVDDVNSDGKPDILAGNWGYNNKFWSGKNGPARLYVSDYDKNGQTDQLLSYTLNGKEYPFLAKDEVERPLPLLRKHYPLYAEYAGVVMKDVFYGWIDTIKPLLCERLGSTLFLNDGKGGFTARELPADLQLAPVFAFQKVKSNGTSLYLAGGNFYEVIPYEGRYDAQPLALFTVQKDGTVFRVNQPSLSAINAQVRDIKLLNTAAGLRVIVAANNEPLRFLKPG